ncbi:MAG TPA: extracellular solute-binding protein [Acetobacteraceae bacterium]|nr:extracellular solute-binding protein [Acetobacteraceae bacterium]
MIRGVAACFAALLACATAGAQTPSPVVGGETIGTPDLVQAACAEGQVVYYTAQSDQDERTIVKPFQQHFPCITVSVISAVTGRLYERLQTEFTAGKVQGDLAILTDEVLVQRLIDQKRLRPWTAPEDAAYPADSKLPGWWYAGSGSLMIPIYNTDTVGKTDAPKSWQDLLDPKWKGKIATSPITIGGTAWVQYDFMQQKFGRDYLVKLAAQQPKLLSAYNLAVLAVARGEQAIAVVSALNEYPVRVDQGAPIAPLYPAEGSPYTNYPMMLLADSPHPHAGELFANWYLSREGQAMLVKTRGAYSVRSDVAPAPGNPPLAQVHPWNPGRAAIQKEHDALIGEFSSIFGGH